jgi:hypothetical protein
LRAFPLRVLCCVGFSESVTLRNLAFGKKPWKPVSGICCFPGIFCSPQSHPCADALCGGLCIISPFLLVFSVSPFLSVCTTNCHTSFWVSLHLQSVKAALTHSVCLLCVHSVFLAIAFRLSLSVVVGGFLFFIFGAGCGGRCTTPFCGSFNLHGVAAPLFEGFIFTTTVLRRPLTSQLSELEEFSCEFR